MATEKQIEANRKNAEKSTGPKTDEGKARSSLNALTHGMAATSATVALMLAETDNEVFNEKKAAYAVDFRPVGRAEGLLFERVVAESIRLERFRDAYFALCRRHGERAREQWEADRRREADDLADRLARQPISVSRRLELNPQGCDVKLELWRGLSASLDANATWTDRQRSLALDLLGVHPDLRDATTPVDPRVGDPLTERRRLVASEIARLEAVRATVTRLDRSERELAETTLGAEFAPPMALLFRYERASEARFQAAWRKLDVARAARSKPTTPAEPRPLRPVGFTLPESAPAPPPRPALPALPTVPRSASLALDNRTIDRPTPESTPSPAPIAAGEPRTTKTPPRDDRNLNRHQRRALAAAARRG